MSKNDILTSAASGVANGDQTTLVILPQISMRTMVTSRRRWLPWCSGETWKYLLHIMNVAIHSVLRQTVERVTVVVNGINVEGDYQSQQNES